MGTHYYNGQDSCSRICVGFSKVQQAWLRWWEVHDDLCIANIGYGVICIAAANDEERCVSEHDLPKCGLQTRKLVLVGMVSSFAKILHRTKDSNNDHHRATTD